MKTATLKCPDVFSNDCTDWFKIEKSRDLIGQKLMTEPEKKTATMANKQNVQNFYCMGANFVFPDEHRKTLLSALCFLIRKLPLKPPYFQNITGWFLYTLKPLTPVSDSLIFRKMRSGKCTYHFVQFFCFLLQSSTSWFHL